MMSLEGATAGCASSSMLMPFIAIRISSFAPVFL
jgi:hypothetical protein